MKRWAVIILKSNNFTDYISVYGENKKEAKINAQNTIDDHFFGATIVRIMPYKKFWGLTKY